MNAMLLYLNPNLTEADLEKLVKLKHESRMRALEHMGKLAEQFDDPVDRLEFITRAMPLLFTMV
jgi:hypothetical protein